MIFATSNINKFNEAKEILKNYELTHLQFDYTEIRSDSLEEIARISVRAAYRMCKEAVFVEDTGLFINHLSGFPGTYSGWVQKKIGNAGILKLMEGVEDRTATFDTIIAYMMDKEHVSFVRGKCEGTISLEPRGTNGFDYDSIFVPDGEHQTFAESIELKNKLSHRYNALLEFSKRIPLRT
ncbi:XTP/dITP diphosphatase [Candidatus Micrarchaeota archaeon]|nr:XTP/dITP diphosphatase [Candidatus Micrarchaeota archaeon]MBU1682157.1 XTP/dITP diphosphatase [Candidatus Micrarchaeota archaeon]